MFIVSYGRTGSTLLQTILQSIPGYFIRGENWNALYPLYRSVQMVRHAKHHHGRIPIPPSHPWYGSHEMEPDRYSRALVRLFLHEILSPPPGQRVIGFKEIRFHNAKGNDFIQFMNFMARFFAPAKFIFNTRNADEVMQSKWWQNIDPAEARAMIETAEAQFDSYIAEHPDTCYHARYEDFRHDPLGLAPMYDFLGEPFDRDVVEAVMTAKRYASW